MSAASTTRRLTRRVAGWALRLVLLALALLVTAAIVVVVVLPRASSGAAMTVLTGSMTPKIPVGSLVLVRPTDPRTLEVGDVATYQVEEGKEVFITHRILKVHDGPNGLSFTFKGDANPGPDLDRVPSGAVRGEVWFHVPHLGAIRDTLHGKGGITLVAIILLGGYALTQISGGLRDRRTTRRSGAPGESRPGFTIERTLLLVQLRRPDEGLPQDVARQWGALLLEADVETYTLLIAPRDDGVMAALELLQSQQPVRIEVWDAPTMLTGSGVDVRQQMTAAQGESHAPD